MWMVQIGVASFWWYLGVHLLFRDALVWDSVAYITWFHRRFSSSSSREWERCCRQAGPICFATGGLLFLGLPHGLGALGLMIAVPSLLFLL